MEKILVTRYEAADMLSVSVKTIDRLTKENKLSRKSIGSRAYYSVSDLYAFIEKEGPLC